MSNGTTGRAGSPPPTNIFMKTPKHKLAKQIVSKSAKVVIRKLPTGVRGLDEILGGGIPEFSFNIIGGAPGCGKTTLAHQIAFANATPKKPALYFTVLGEPVLKMLRYQQQFSFFDESKVGKEIRFINLSDAMAEKDLNVVLDEIIKQVTAANAGVVVVDSFRTIVRKESTTTTPALAAVTCLIISSSTTFKSFSAIASDRLIKRISLPTLDSSKKENCC